MSSDIGIIIGGIMSDLGDIDLSNVDVFTGVRIVDAGKIAVELEANGAKAIISTGGTMPEIEKHVQLPVVCANPTYFDLLESLNNMQQSLNVKNEKVALILHISRVIDVDRLQRFLNNKLSLFQYQDEEHLHRIILQLYSEKFKVLLGGPTTLYIAKQLGMTAFPLALGRETMSTALEKTRYIINLIQQDREQTQRLKTVLDVFYDGIITTDSNGIVTMCNPKALALLNLEESKVIGRKVYQITADPSWVEVYQKGIKQTDVIREIGNSKLFLSRQPIIINDRIIGAVGTFQEAIKIEKLEHQYRKIQTLGLTAKRQFGDIIGDSMILRQTIEKAKAYSKVNATILIEGETGTGKEIFAQSIHNASPRQHGPFVAINCAALPEALLESELMGYDEGAFTGAKKGGKAGLFELAHKGTIFLDEINQLPLSLQARVLRIIQEKEVIRLGGERVVPIDVHIIAATNENLALKVHMREFRDDLYFRINVLRLRLPPLRERVEDIPLLLKYYVQYFSSAYGTANSFSKSSLDILIKYHWPGNVRELANFVERYTVLNKQSPVSEQQYVNSFLAETNEFSSTRSNSDQSSNLVKIEMGTLDSMETQLIKKVLTRCEGNRELAASLLGVSRTTIWNKLGKKGNIES